MPTVRCTMMILSEKRQCTDTKRVKKMLWRRSSLSLIKHLCFTAAAATAAASARDGRRCHCHRRRRLVRYSFQLGAKPLFRRPNLSPAYSKPQLSCNPAYCSRLASESINSSKSWRRFMGARVQQRQSSESNERIKPSLYRCLSLLQSNIPLPGDQAFTPMESRTIRCREMVLMLKLFW